MLPRLVTFKEYNHLVLPGMIDLLNGFFTIEVYDPDTCYDKQTTLFVCNNYQYQLNTNIILQLVDLGYKLVFDDLQECVPTNVAELHDRDNVLHMICLDSPKHTEGKIKTHNVPMFFWVHDSRIFSDTIGDNRGLHKQRTFAPDKKFLLLMNNQREHRDRIIDEYQNILDQGLFTYVARGITLPGDRSSNQIGWNRSVNVEWYNQTAFSICTETAMDPGPGHVFITEKTFKPMQLMHPFLIVGCAGTLALLHRYGFETFDNMFDETYDSIKNYDARLDRVMSIADEYQFSGYDIRTMEKLNHNRERFYDLGASQKYYVNEVIKPMIEFLEA